MSDFPFIASIGKDAITKLVENGRFNVDNDYWLTLKTSADCDTAINDFDCYGKVQFVRGLESQRPSKFDGSAEVIDRWREGKVWWQPYRDGSKVFNSDKDRQTVKDIVEHGFRMVTVSLYGPCWDARKVKHTINLAQHSVGGIEPFCETKHVAEIVFDILQDID